MSVACAYPNDGFWQTMSVIEGTTALEAIKKSGVLEHFKELETDTLSIGIYALPAKLDVVLVEGDRVEIYRPLLVDPKTVPRKAKLKTKKKK
ncbi:MAG: RnfH family protein [bacterium]|nr:RnfH family protein [bacterium]